MHEKFKWVLMAFLQKTEFSDLVLSIDYYGFLTVSFEQLWFIPEVHQVKHLRSAAYLGGGVSVGCLRARPLFHFKIITFLKEFYNFTKFLHNFI